MCAERARCGSRGFTLAEALVTLAIVAVLAGIAIPSVADGIRNTRLKTQVNDLVLALQLARSEAVKQGTPVTLCKSADRASCGRGIDWEAGWIVFADADRDRVVDAGEAILRQHGALPEGYSLRGNSNVASAISFDATGVTANSGTLVLCQQRQPQRARAVVVNLAGRIRQAPDHNGNGTPELRNCAGSADIDITSCTPAFVPTC